MKATAAVVIGIVAMYAALATALSFDADAALQWLNDQGCTRAKITNCPGNRPCTDAEFFARALAAGGAIDLDPNVQSQAPYSSYMNNTYNLCLSPGLINYLESVGFKTLPGSANATFPKGAVGFTTMYSPGAPFMALGGGYCSAHTPVVYGGVHCNVTCAYEIPRIAYVAPQPKPSVSP